jgi:hypothetical protein
MSNINVVAEDYGYDINFTLTESDGTALDLTDSTITFVMYNTQRVYSKTATITIAASGTCHYTVVQNDFIYPGTYEYDIRVTYATKVITVKATDNIIVSEKVG